MKKINFKNLTKKVNTKKIAKVVMNVLDVILAILFIYYITTCSVETVVTALILFICINLIIDLFAVISVDIELTIEYIAEFIGTTILFINDSFKNY